MKKGINTKSIGHAPMMPTMLFGFSICDNEDNVVETLNNKTWKLSRITTEKGEEQSYRGLRSNEAEEKASRELFKIAENFTLSSNRTDVNGKATGAISAYAAKVNISDAILKMDGKEHVISISGKIYGSESGRLAKVFISDLLSVFKYEGDMHNLTPYFKGGNTTKAMGSTAH